MKTDLRSLPLRRSVVDVGQLAQRRTVLAEAQRCMLRSYRLAAPGGGDCAAAGTGRGPERHGPAIGDEDP